MKEISGFQKLSLFLGLVGAVIMTVSLFYYSEAEVGPANEHAKIVASRALVKSMVENAVLETPSLKDDIDGLTKKMEEAAVGQELLVAEAFSQGLAKSDYIVRNRMVEMQVMSLYERADAGLSEEKAFEFFENNPDRYMTLPRREYLHLYVPINNLVNEKEAREKLEVLLNNRPGWGSPKWVTEYELRKAYGPTLAETVFSMPMNEWGDAIKTSFGWHYIKVLSHSPSRPYKYDEVSFRALEDLRRKLRQDAYKAELGRLKKKYEVE